MSALTSLPAKEPLGAGDSHRARQAALRQRYEHLSKKTRIELVGNDHNYNLRREEEPPELKLSAAAAEALEAEPALEAGAQHMDDCMAAMVLMFLSCRPGEQPQVQQLQQAQNSSAKAAKRNSEPIEMDTSSQQKLYQRQHFKRRLFADEQALRLAGEQSDEEAHECSWKARRRRNKADCRAGDPDEPDEDEELQHSSASSSSSTSGVHSSCKLDDEMIFELQQVDESEESAPAEALGKRAGSIQSAADSAASEASTSSPASSCVEERLVGSRAADSPRKQAQQAHQQQTQPLRPLQQLMQHQLRFRMGNPVKTRTVFSCMWPSCTKNCDLLEDIERHVRAHLGPKQCDAIGDEDFYYEETEVDEATYLAIFGGRRPQPRDLAPLSPSHNSDGLSSGHSFSSSSPATSPVCSTDSSSSASSHSSASSSSTSSTGCFQTQQLFANSIDWGHFLGAGGKWQSSFAGSSGGQQLYLPAPAQRGRPRKQPPAHQHHHLTSSHHKPHNQHYHGRKPTEPSDVAPVGAGPLQFSLQLAAPVPSPPPSPASAISRTAANQKHYLAKETLAKEKAPAADHTYGAPKDRPRKPGRPRLHPVSPQQQAAAQGLPAPSVNRNNHLKHNLSQRFFHNQSTSSHQQLPTKSNSNNQFNSSNGNNSNDSTGHSAGRSETSASPSACDALAQQQLAKLHKSTLPPVLTARRVRGENRKCRKVYGMERRDLWCTQCKWKKACSRFCDQ